MVIPDTPSWDGLSRPSVTHLANPEDLPAEVGSITGELFPGTFTLDWDADPELPERRFLVLTVRANGDPKDRVRRRRE